MSGLRSSIPVQATPVPRGLVLLGGSVRPSQFSRAIGRSLLDLPVEPDLGVLQLWEVEALRLAQASELSDFPVRVVLDRSVTQPVRNGAAGPIRLTFERDANEYRGTAGVLRDISGQYAPEELLLVASAGQILVEPLSTLARDLLATEAEVALLGHDDGTPGALFMVNCSIFAKLGEVGFLDFKEQALPRLASSGANVRVVQRPCASGFPVRTLDSYIAGLRAYYNVKAGKPVTGNPFDEDWSPTFALVEPNAHVDPAATIHDSVVLDGARVERNAVVVRSIVCPGAVVPAGQTVAGQIVEPEHAPRKPR